MTGSGHASSHGTHMKSSHIIVLLLATIILVGCGPTPAQVARDQALEKLVAATHTPPCSINYDDKSLTRRNVMDVISCRESAASAFTLAVMPNDFARLSRFYAAMKKVGAAYADGTISKAAFQARASQIQADNQAGQFSRADIPEDDKRDKGSLRQGQLDADKAQCAAYGIQRGTKDFSACLIQLDQSRQQQAQQSLALQAQAQEQENARKSQAWQNLSNVGVQMMQQAQPTYVPPPMANTNCRNSAQGINCTTW
jgi:hypothetical protein